MTVKKLSSKQKKLKKPTSKTTSKSSRVQRQEAKENNSITKRRKDILNSISQIPSERLPELENKIKEILGADQQKKEPKSLAGIWANKGFENIDLKKALKEARDAMLQGTLNKNYE